MKHVFQKVVTYLLCWLPITAFAYDSSLPTFSNNIHTSIVEQSVLKSEKSILLELASIKASPGDIFLGFVASLGLGYVAGSAYGVMSRITMEELSERGFKDLGVMLAWFIAPAGRTLTVIAANLLFQMNGIRANYIVSLLAAQAFDWLVYFEKISAPSLDPAYKKQYCKKRRFHYAENKL